MKCVVAFATLFVSAAMAHGDDLMDEHMGSIFRSVQAPGCDTQMVRDVTPAGTMEDLGGVQTYVSQALDKKTEIAILYLSDIFGLPLVNNKLLADSFAKAGYFVVFPDLFKGDPVPVNMMGTPGWNMTAWRDKHPVAGVDSIIESTVKAAKAKYGIKKIGAAGYCFGGKYVARHLSANGSLDAGFTAHPSGITADELKAVDGPMSIAYADTDSANPPAARDLVEETFYKSGITWQQTLYSWVDHGFAVRANLTDSRQKFAQESAYLQAARWFDHWLKGM